MCAWQVNWNVDPFRKMPQTWAMLKYHAQTTSCDMLCSSGSLNVYYCNGQTNNDFFSRTDAITLKIFFILIKIASLTTRVGTCTSIRNACFPCDFA